jgi:hypothetical protein
MVDGKGEPVGAARPVLGTQALNDVVIKWAISEFIRNAKTVSANLDEEKELLRNAYAFASQQAAKALDDYYHDGEHDPFTIEQKSWMKVRLTRAPLRLPAPDTYQVDWIESRHEYGSELISTTTWRATLKGANGRTGYQRRTQPAWPLRNNARLEPGSSPMKSRSTILCGAVATALIGTGCAARPPAPAPAPYVPAQSLTPQRSTLTRRPTHWWSYPRIFARRL